MLTQSKIVLAAALMLSTASAAMAARVVPRSRAGINPDQAGAVGDYAFAPSATHNGAVAVPRPGAGCDNVYRYDRALDGYSYDLVCNGIDLSPH